MPFSMVVEACKLGDIFSFLFDDIGVSTRCRGVMVTTLSLPPMVPRISLVVLALFVNLALVGRRL